MIDYSYNNYYLLRYVQITLWKLWVFERVLKQSPHNVICILPLDYWVVKIRIWDFKQAPSLYVAGIEARVTGQVPFVSEVFGHKFSSHWIDGRDAYWVEIINIQVCGGDAIILVRLDRNGDVPKLTCIGNSQSHNQFFFCISSYGGTSV